MRKHLVVSLVFLCAAIHPAVAVDTVTGWLVDTKCQAKGKGTAHADCARKCIEAGAKLALVTDDDGRVLTIENPDSLKGREGQHIELHGDITGDSLGVVPATSAQPAKNEGQKTEPTRQQMIEAINFYGKDLDASAPRVSAWDTMDFLAKYSANLALALAAEPDKSLLPDYYRKAQTKYREMKKKAGLKYDLR